MSIELKAGLATAIGVFFIVLIAVFLWYASRRKSPAPEADHKRIYELRLIYFFILTVGLAATLGGTLQRLPYPNFHTHPPKMVVNVTGSDWLWKFDIVAGPGAGTTSYNRLSLLAAGQVVEFRVTSADVNHGFGLYNNSGTLLGQTQAMPGFVNRLYFQFPKSGTYHVDCLEYCGVGHQLMHAEIKVTSPPHPIVGASGRGSAHGQGDSA